MPDVVRISRRFIATFSHVILRPVSFFTLYREIVMTRKAALLDLHEQAEDDRYLAPAKFAAITVAINTLLLPVLIGVGAAVGSVTSDFADFYEMTREQGLWPPTLTGVGFIDDFIYETLKLAAFYLLGVLMWALSGRKIPVRFAAGYYFYVNAWSLVGHLLELAFVLTAIVLPVYATGLPQLAQLGVSLVTLFMVLGFPILFWPKMLEIERRRVAIAVGVGIVIWIAAAATAITSVLPA